MRTEIVYVELLDEGTPVWRPVDAEALGGDRHRLIAPLDYDPEIEIWAVLPGSVVRCAPETFKNGTGLAVVELVAASDASESEG